MSVRVFIRIWILIPRRPVRKLARNSCWLNILDLENFEVIKITIILPS